MHITDRQADGLLVVLLATAAVFLYVFFSMRAVHQVHPPIHGDPQDGPVIVRLSVHSGGDGIYYLPERTTLSALLATAGVKHADRFDRDLLLRPLKTGMAVIVAKDGSLGVSEMQAAERIALGLAIDLNRATPQDLMLIPGIGEGTAQRIVRFRESAGPFKKVSDLAKVSGIKEKRLRQWEPFLEVAHE